MIIRIFLLVFSFQAVASSGGYLPPVVPDLPPERLMNSGFPVSVLKISETDLYGENGILFFDERRNNRLERGEAWERPGEFFFYRNGKREFSAPVGVRIHGGSSRMFPDNSFRLYLREVAVPEGMILSEKAGILDRLLIHRANDYISFFADAVSALLGAENTELRPTAFFLNDIFWGVYFLGEHLSARQWQRYMKDSQDFYFYSFKSDNSDEFERESAVHFERLRKDWLLKSSKVTMFEAQKFIDMENFIAHMFTFAYLGTTDWMQGAAVKEGRILGRWKFIHWDLEQSIVDEAVKKKNICIDLNRRNWQQESFELMLTGVKWNKESLHSRPFSELDFRHLLFYRLWFEDTEFRKTFSSFVQSALERKLTAKRLGIMVNHYRRLAESLNIEIPGTVSEAQEFFAHRNDEISRKLKLILTFPFLRWDFQAVDGRPEVLGLFGIPEREGCR